MRKSAIFQTFMRGLPDDMAFCISGPIWSPKARLARWGRSNPFAHAHRENRPIFQNKSFPLNASWIMCSWTPQYRWAPPEHPRDTSHAVHFPLVASSSQSALYVNRVSAKTWWTRFCLCMMAPIPEAAGLDRCVPGCSCAGWQLHFAFHWMSA